MDRRDAMPVLHDASDILAVRHPSDRAVVPRREDRAIANDDRTDVLAGAGGARGDLARDIHEVGVPVDAVAHAGILALGLQLSASSRATTRAIPLRAES